VRDVGRRNLIPAVLQQADGIQLEQFVVGGLANPVGGSFIQ